MPLTPDQLASSFPGAAPDPLSQQNSDSDDGSGGTKASYIGADLQAQDDGTASGSISDIAGNIVTKGIPLVGASILNSFANTAVSVGNFFGGDFQEQTIQKEFGEESPTTSYYERNAGVIEGAGLAVGSLLPGLGAIKALKLAEASGTFGSYFQASTGLFSGIRKEILAQATKDAFENSTAESLFGATTVSKTKAIAAGAADNFLQGLVYQTATLGTMGASPLLAHNTISDNVKDVLESGIGFGVLGGLADGFSAVSKINKALGLADAETKAQEIVGRQGLGNLTPGDRILGLINQKLDTFPAANTLGAQKAKFADDVFNRDMSAHFDELAGGDTDLSQTFQNYIREAVFKQGLQGDDLANQIGLLAKIGRNEDDSIGASTSNVFYIPSRVDLTDSNVLDQLGVRPESLLQDTSSVEGKTQFSKAFVKNYPTSPLNIQHAFNPEFLGIKVTDAYKKGVDVFIDRQGKVHINPDSSNLEAVPRPGESRVLGSKENVTYRNTGNLPSQSKPLRTSAIWLRLKDNTLLGQQPVSVVGDIGPTELVDAFGKTGLKVGNPEKGGMFFPIDTSPEATFQPKSPLEANAEYVYWAKRSIPDEASVDPNHLPKLEALWKQWNDAATAGTDPLDYLDNHSISIKDAEHIETPDDLLDHISSLKQELFQNELSENPTASSEVLSKKLNTPESFFLRGPDFSNPASIITPLEENEKINHVRLSYDISHTKDLNGNILRGLQASEYRYMLAAQANSDAMAALLNKRVGPQKASSYLSSLKVDAGINDAAITGAGEGLFSAANGGYGSLAQKFERVGRSFSDLQLLAHQKIHEALAPVTAKILRDPKLAAEYGNFTFVRHSTPETYAFLPEDVAVANNLTKDTAVLQGAITKRGSKITYDPSYMPDGFQPGDGTGEGLKTFYNLSPEVAALERTNASLLAERNDLRDNFLQAQGLSPREYDPDTLYAPPINTARYPYFALVRQKEGYAMGESGAQMIVGSSAADLQRKMALLPPEYEAFTKQNIGDYFKTRGDYDYNRNFNSLKIKSDLARSGVLTGFVPEVRGQNLVNDLLQFHKNQETQLLRDHIEIHNAKIFAQLDAMGERWIATNNSTFSRLGLSISKQLAPENPYASYTRTALGVSSKDNYPLWSAAQDKLEAFGNTAFNVLQGLGKQVQKGIVSPEEASRISSGFGLGNQYGAALDSLSKAAYYGGIANRLPDKNIISRVIGAANAFLGSAVIRLDSLQQLVHAVTLPIMTQLEYGGATAGLQKLLFSEIKPGQSVLSFSRTLYNAVKNFWGPDSEKLSQMYASIGMPRDQIFQIKRMVDELSFPAGPTDRSGWMQKLSKAGDIAEKIVGTKFVNEFNHFISADVGRQIGEAKGLSGQDLLDHIATFQNRVLGNLAAGQRGAIFHGPVGQAIGLFQSYQFNLYQQIFRNLVEGNAKSVALAAGMQSSIFGLSSMPGFKSLNTLIQTHDGNAGGEDLYSTAVRNLPKGLADTLLYGGLSAGSGMALFSRGDINPRRATLLPVNPLEIPAVATAMRVYDNILQTGKNISNGGPVGANLLLALEHNSMSRPLGGLAEMMQGYVTDNKGNLVSNIRNPAMGWSDMFSVANFSRLLGARPLDEALHMEALYNYSAAKQGELAKMEDLGRAFKSALYNRPSIAGDELVNFAQKYAAAGGNINSFNKQVLSWTNQAHTPAANLVFKRLGSDPRAKTAMLEMGGVPLPAFSPSSSEGSVQ